MTDESKSGTGTEDTPRLSRRELVASTGAAALEPDLDGLRE